MGDIKGGFDLKVAKEAVAAEDEGQVVHVLDPEGEPLFYENGSGPKPVTMKVAGTYSRVFRKAADAQKNRLSKGGRSRSEDTQLELQAACVLDWDGFFDNGQRLACDKENVTQILDGFLWIRQQVAEAMYDHAGFFKRSSDS